MTLAAAVAWLCRTAPGEASAPAATFYVERGWRVTRIAAELEKAGLVANRHGFVLVAKVTRLSRRLRAGEFRVPHGQGPRAVLDALAYGKPVQHYFMIPPGETAAQAAAALRDAGLDPRRDAAAWIDDPAFASSLGVPAPRLEGFLLPETYAWERGENAKALLARMVKQFQRVWQEKFAAPATASGLSELEVVTLASIIEKESGYAPERPIIARVLLNRLARRMPLQSDPTTIYALGADYRGALTREDLQRDLPYNTYVRAGLPPGPICNPGAEAIAAALAPAAGDWLYFVAAGEGRHVFTNSYAEHLRAVDRYLKGQTQP